MLSAASPIVSDSIPVHSLNALSPMTPLSIDADLSPVQPLNASFPMLDNDKRSKLTEIFRDTLDYINEEEDLYDCIEYSKRESELIKADEYYDLETPNRAGNIKVTQSKTFEAAMRYALPI